MAREHRVAMKRLQNRQYNVSTYGWSGTVDTEWSVSRPWEPLPSGMSVVTGAAGGIGRRVTELILELGGSVIAADLDAAALDALSAAVQSERLFTQVTDVSSEEDMSALERRVRDADLPLRLWVNNAGIGLRKPAAEITVAEWNRVFSVNVVSTLLGSQAAHRLFHARGAGGAIVNVSSVAAVRTLPGRSAYGASKASVAQLTRQLAVEWGPEQIRVNAVAPGFILTPISHLFGASDEVRDEAISDIPMRRLGEVEDIARAVLVLGSEMSAYQSGQLVVVDGGLTLG